VTVPNLHKKGAPSTIRWAIVTCSSSRYQKKLAGQPINDPSGDTAAQLLNENGNKVVLQELLTDSCAKIRHFLLKLFDSNLDSILLIGGTGITSHDVTIEAVKPLLDKELTGFGELFRTLSYKQIKTSAIMSRSLAGVVNNKVIFCIPGSPDAVKLSLTEIILPEIHHILNMITSKRVET
jgi:molybdenum cofactor biosynthesis protein B